MSVIFYPEKNINRLDELILNQDGKPLNGEIAIYKSLYKSLSESKKEYHVWHDLSLPEHIDGYFEGINVNPKGKTSAQIDFLILCDEGLVVLEVKGGEISYYRNQFYYGNDFAKKCDDPFSQSQGYKYTLKEKVLRGFNGFFSNAVAFPHIKIKFSTKIHNENQLWSEFTSKQYHSNSIEKFLLNWIDTEKTLHRKKGRRFSNYDKLQIDQIIRTLSPKVSDENPMGSLQDTQQWLEIQNIEILTGLQKNDRIMIEGPPGSGKTTFALAFADRYKSKKGLYLCWNTLLGHAIKGRISKRKLDKNLEVFTFHKFMQTMGGYSFEELSSSKEIEYYEKAKSTLTKIKAFKKEYKYDYIIMDEAQDYAEKGIELLIQDLCGINGKGLENGIVLLLYDIDQSYSWNGRDVKDDIDYLSEFFAHYKLHEIKRSSQAPGIKELSIEVLYNGNLLSESNHIKIENFDSFKEAKKSLLKNYLHHIRNPKSSLLGKDCILLGESAFYNSENDAYFPDNFIVTDMEELTRENVLNTKNVLRHCSILRYKGLESKNVFLFTTKINNYNQYELFIGITRAINYLHIFIINE